MVASTAVKRSARAQNMTRFAAGKLPGQSKNCLRKSKDKAVTEKRSFKRWVSVEKFIALYTVLQYFHMKFAP